MFTSCVNTWENFLIRHAPGFFYCFCQYACVFVCMCVSAPRLLITNGVIWTLYDRLNKFYSFYMAAVVISGSKRDLRIEAHCRNQPSKIKFAL